MGDFKPKYFKKGDIVTIKGFDTLYEVFDSTERPIGVVDEVMLNYIKTANKSVTFYRIPHTVLKYATEIQKVLYG